MSLKFLNFIAVLLFAISVPLPAAVTGRVSGTIKDASGAAIPGAAITLTNTAQGIQTKASADSSGNYSLPSIPVGTYDLLFEAAGFRAEKRTDLVIDANAEIEQNITLQVAART